MNSASKKAYFEKLKQQGNGVAVKTPAPQKISMLPSDAILSPAPLTPIKPKFGKLRKFMGV